MLDFQKELTNAEEEMRAGSPDRALSILFNLKTSLETDEAKKDLPDNLRLVYLVKVLNNIGVVQKNIGDFEAATNSLEAALEIVNNTVDDNIRMRCGILSNLGLLYSRRQMYLRGKAVFDEALNLSESNPKDVPDSLKIKLRNNRALFYVRFGELDKAKEELDKALEISRGQDSKAGVIEREAWLNANLAVIHSELGDEEIYDVSRQEELFRLAKAMFLRSAEMYSKEGYLNNKLKQLLNVVEIEIRLGALEEARRRLKEVRKDAERINSGRLLCEIAHINVQLAIRSGDRESVIDRVHELLAAFKNFNPPDLPARQAKLETLLRQAGRNDALKLINDYTTQKKAERNVPKTTAFD